MAKYRIYTQIESNVSTLNLFYDLTVYRTDGDDNRHTLVSVTQQPVNAGYLTQQHETGETDDDLSVIYLMEIMLYRRHGGKLIPALSIPSTKMYTLGEMASGNAFSANKRENVCYFETLSPTKPVNEEGDKNIHSVKITCLERVFVSEEHPVNDPLDPFTKEKVSRQLDGRKAASLLNPEGNYYPDQYYTMLCGPAAFFFCLMNDRFDVYQQIIWDLWSFGRVMLGDFTIEPTAKTKRVDDLFNGHSLPQILAIDWISMASLRDSSNILLGYSHVGDKVSAITLWGDIEKWMKSAGSRKLFSNISMINSNIKDICDLNSFIGEGRHVICLISAGMLQQGVDIRLKDHWIVWDGPLVLLKGGCVTPDSNRNELVSLRLFSWGEVRDNGLRERLTLGEFSDYLFGGMVFTKIP